MTTQDALHNAVARCRTPEEKEGRDVWTNAPPESGYCHEAGRQKPVEKSQQAGGRLNCPRRARPVRILVVTVGCAQPTTLILRTRDARVFVPKPRLATTKEKKSARLTPRCPFVSDDLILSALASSVGGTAVLMAVETQS